MNKPNIDETQAVFQAGETIHTYLSQAVKILDDKFGAGYARAQPALLGELVRCQTLDFNNTSQIAAQYAMSEAVGELTQTIASGVNLHVRNEE